jgi:hypothetical protein
MRPLWPIEREVLKITAAEYSATPEAFRRQIETALVASFENTGAGFFSDLVVAADVPLLGGKTPLSGAYGSVLGIEHGMGFIVFLKAGRLSMIEGYCNGDVSTVSVDFSRVVYGLIPWSPARDSEP